MAVFLPSMHRSALNPKNCNRFLLLQDCVRDSKKRRTDRVNNSFWSNKQITDSSSIEKWLMARKKIGKFFANKSLHCNWINYSRITFK